MRTPSAWGRHGNRAVAQGHGATSWPHVTGPGAKGLATGNLGMAAVHKGPLKALSDLFDRSASAIRDSGMKQIAIRVRPCVQRYRTQQGLYHGTQL